MIIQNQNMWNFLPRKKNQQLYYNFLVKRLVEEQLQSASGSARDFFRKDYFYSLKIAIPCDSTLEKFHNLVISLFEKIDTNISENQQLAELRDWLLPMLMNGQVKV